METSRFLSGYVTQTLQLASTIPSMSKEQQTMSAIFVDDGAPDASEFRNNYIWFETENPTDFRRAWSAAESLWERRSHRLRERGSPILPRRPVVRRYARPIGEKPTPRVR